MERQTQTPDDSLTAQLTRASVRRALRSINNLERLAASPLAQLAASAPTYSGVSPLAAGQALRDMLRQSIEALRPDLGPPIGADRRWRPYIILSQRYLLGRAPGNVAADLHIERDTYNHSLGEALDQLVGVLRHSLAPQPAPAGAAAIYTLRPPSASFIGRRAEIDQLCKHLAACPDEHQPVAVICGMGGIGKTELAMQVAHTLRQQYPDVQALFDLQSGSPSTPEELLSALIWMLSPATPQSRDLGRLQALYRQITHHSRGLLVLDNVLDSAQLAGLLPPPAGWAVLVTSRRRLTPPDSLVLRLNVLTLAEATHLLRKIFQEGGRDDLSAAPDSDLDALATACGSLPIALRIAAANLCTYIDWSIADYLGLLEQGRLSALQLHEQRVDAILELSLDQLRQQDEELVQRWVELQVFPAPFDRAAAAAVWGLTEPQTLRLLGTLCQHSLLEFHREARTYSLHDLLLDIAAARPCDRERLHISHAHHYCGLVRQADQLYRQGGQDLTDGLALFDRARPHIDSMLAWLLAPERAGNQQIDALILSYIQATGTIGLLRHDPQQQALLMRRAIRAARHQGQHELEGNIQMHLGIAMFKLGESGRALEHLKQAVAVGRAAADSALLRRCLTNLGYFYSQLGDLRAAIRCYEESISLCRTAADLKGLSHTLSNMSVAYICLGYPLLGIEHCEHAIQIATEIGEQFVLAYLLDTMGGAYNKLGQPTRAIRYHEQALEIYHALNLPHGQSQNLHNLGAASIALGEPQRALDYFKRAEALLRQGGERGGLAYISQSMSEAELASGRLVEAQQHAEQALSLAQEFGNRYVLSLANWTLGRCLVRQGAWDRGIALMQQCIAYEREMEHGELQQHLALLGEMVQQRLGNHFQVQ